MDRYRRLLRRRDFALLWGGATISALGDGMSFVALVWLLIERGASPADVGWFAAAYTAPVIVGGIAAGVILDRFDARLVIAGDNVIRGVIIASVPIAAALGVLTTAHLFVVAIVYGLLYMASIAGIPTLIPSLVERDELTTANAMESITYGIAGLVGPALAGVVILALGATAVLALDAVTYGAFVVCLLAMRSPRRGRPVAGEAEAAGGAAMVAEPAPVPDGAPVASATTGIGPAIRFIVTAPAIVATTVMYMCLNISSGLMIVVIPIYAVSVLGGGAETFGLLLSALTAGELVGLLVIGAVRWPFPLGRSIAGAAVLSGATLSLLLFEPPLAAMVVILAGSGLAESSLTPWAQTIRMRLIPPELRGRVFALLRTLMQSTRPVGAILAGILITGGDLTLALAAVALLVGVPGVIGLFVPALGPGPTAEGSPASSPA